jgi:hypothetical protein
MALPTNTQNRGIVFDERWGVLLGLLAGNSSFDIEIQRAPDSAGAPDVANAVTIDVVGGQLLQYTDILPHTLGLHWYRARHVRTSWTAGAWTDWVSAFATRIPDESFSGIEGKRRVDSFYAADGTLLGSVGQSDGVNVRILARGHITGTCQHGDVITFPYNFQNVPRVWFEGGVTHQPAAKWGTAAQILARTAAGALLAAPEYDDSSADALSVSGFTARLRLVQKGTLTTTNIEFLGTVMSAIGDTVLLNSASNKIVGGPAVDDRYTCRMNCTIQVDTADFLAASGSATFALEIDAAGTGSWVERGTLTFNVSGNTSVSKTFTGQALSLTVAGLTANSKARWKLKSTTVSSGAMLTVSGRGSDNAPTAEGHGLSFVTSTGDQYASRTPDVSDLMTWHAMETT